MTRHEYIKIHANELYKLNEKMKRLSARYTDESTTQKKRQNINAEMNWCGMHIAQTEERLLFALGNLLPEDARKEYSPSEFHTYPGIGLELSKTKFDL